MNPVTIILAALGTLAAFLWSKKYTAYVSKTYNTQAFVDPNTVPPQDLNAAADAVTLRLTQLVKIPQAQIASGWAEQLALLPLNPSVPPMSYGNTGLDTTNPQYISRV